MYTGQRTITFNMKRDLTNPCEKTVILVEKLAKDKI